MALEIDISDPDTRLRYPEVAEDLRRLLGLQVVVDTLPAAAGDIALNVDVHRAVALTLTGDIRLSLVSSTAGQLLMISFVLRLTQGAGGPHYVTWPATVRWTGGYAPGLMGTEGGSDVLQFVSFDGGATWTGGRLAQTGAA